MNKQHRRLLSLLKRKLELRQNIDAWRLRVKDYSLKGHRIARSYRVILVQHLKRDQRLQCELNEWVYSNIECESDIERAIKFSRYLLFVDKKQIEDKMALFLMFESQLNQMRRFI